MTEGSASHVANYVLESILKDLAFLKENNYIPNQTYKDVVSILPTRIESTTEATATINKPPLPTRKATTSTSSPKSNSIPTPQPREIVSSSFPKLPTRRNNDWPPQNTANTTTTKNILHSEPEKLTAAAPPPAYSQRQSETTSLLTVEALYDYNGEDPSTDLSFKQGNIIEVTEYVNDDWWKGTVDGKTGIFPQNHVKKIAPSIKPKRPWVPPTAAKPSFSTSSNTSSNYSSSNNNTPPPPAAYNHPPQYNQPYSYPPPPTAIYQAPPAQPPMQVYGQPSYAVSHPPPPPAQPATGGEHEEDSKVNSMAKKFGNQAAVAATWGFAGTLGSKAANAIF